MSLWLQERVLNFTRELPGQYDSAPDAISAARRECEARGSEIIVVNETVPVARVLDRGRMILPGVVVAVANPSDLIAEYEAGETFNPWGD